MKIVINDAGLHRHLKRLQQTGLLGSSTDQVAANLIRKQIMGMLNSGELFRLETFARESIAQESSNVPKR